MNPPPPPPPPPHGSPPPNNGSGPNSNSNSGKRGGLPDGNYDIFIIPPHSAGSGFLYLPSLQPQRNSFLAGVGCTLAVVAIYTTVLPALKQWVTTIAASGGIGVVVLALGMGIAGWAWGKTQLENGRGPFGGQSGASGYANNAGSTHNGPPPNAQPPPQSHHYEQARPPPPQPEWNSHGSPNGGTNPKPSWSSPPPGAGANTPTGTGAAKSAWEKAREETKKKEEEKRRAEEVRARVEELRKRREAEEAERKKQREKETREREIRERREKEAKERAERAERATAASASARPSPNKARQPTARTEADEDAYSYRPYDSPKAKTNSASSVYSSSYAPSQSTARSTPPPSHRGPYTTKDPDKIVLKAVYSFNNAHQKLPLSQLVSGVGPVTDGLILRITTEGLFIDDDVRSVPQREWDVKAWTMKLVETAEFKRMQVIRASIKDQEGKRFVFVLPEEESWKVALGVQRLKKGSQARALSTAGLPMNECKALLEQMGWA